VKQNPTRFAGFATLPTALPEKAAEELERMVRDHSFKGAVINGHHRGRYLDDRFFWPILERAESLSVPIYLHPTLPPKPVIEASYGGFSSVVTTFSGFNFMATFLDLLLQVGVERIMFSADYPYASMERARSFLEQIPVSAADRERIAHRNAERLFGL
jgi:predicted TIM-barrel fold metal-dependent hydrolase